MPQFGVIVYSPAPADPDALSAEHLASLDDFPARAKALRGKVLGGSYFPKQRGFAFSPSLEAVTVSGEVVREGTFAESNQVPAAFFVLAAPDIEVAVEIARQHPAVLDGGVEVRRLFVPDGPPQDDYAD